MGREIHQTDQYRGYNMMYTYEIRFFNVSPNRIDFLETHFKDYSCGSSFDTKNWIVVKAPNSVFFKFTSPKHFDCDIDSGSNGNLACKLLGKDQFFSEIWYQFINDNEEQYDMGKIEVIFIDVDQSEWEVKLSNSSSMRLARPAYYFEEGISKKVKLRSFASFAYHHTLMKNRCKGKEYCV